MKVKLIMDCRGPNPDFDPSEPRSAENSPHEARPMGTEIEDPQAWILCLPNARKEIYAEPIDDEAKAAVARHLEKQRAAKAAKQKQRAAAAASKKKPIPTGK